MERIKDDFLVKIGHYVDLVGKSVLEVGCGFGTRSKQIAELCSTLTAIEPDLDTLNTAKKQNVRPNIHYVHAAAERLPFENGTFDSVIFTLSFHHVPAKYMEQAIHEAARVIKQEGHVIFFEPATHGSFFDSEVHFDACDGDERKEKALAYYSMLSHPALQEVAELYDETIFKFASLADFEESMTPKKNKEYLEQFLKDHNFLLSAERRINIFKVKTIVTDR